MKSQYFLSQSLFGYFSSNKEKPTQNTSYTNKLVFSKVIK